MRLAGIAALLAATLATHQLSAQERSGSEFQINTYTTNMQRGPAVAVDSNGNFVAVWNSFGSNGNDTSDRSIQGQRFDAEGNAMGGEFQINTYTTNRQWVADVAADPNGNFVVVWQSGDVLNPGPDGSSASIQGQRFDVGGIAAGSEFQINTYTTNIQTLADVAVDAAGNFVVVWQSGDYVGPGPDGSYASIQGQRYDPTGTAVGGEFQVNTYTTSYQYSPSVAVDADGDFVVVWTSYGSSGTDTDSFSIQGQRYDEMGARAGEEFQVNTYTPGGQLGPAVAIEADGDFVVVWSSGDYLGTGPDGSFASIQGQRYDSTGTAIGGEFQVNSYTTGYQRQPVVGTSGNGDFVVVWFSPGSSGTDTSSYSVQGKRFDATGTVVGGEFQVNSYTTGFQVSGSVALEADGDFVVVWSSDGSSGTDTDSFSVQGQRFATPVIFNNNFEAGDLGGWSSVFPPSVP